MRISIKTKKRRLLITTGDDADETPAIEWLQMSGGDFQVVPEEEAVYYEEEEGARALPNAFGFQVTSASKGSVAL